MTNTEIMETLKEILTKEENLSFKTTVEITNIIDTLKEREGRKKRMIENIEKWCNEI